MFKLDKNNFCGVKIKYISIPKKTNDGNEFKTVLV